MAQRDLTQLTNDLNNWTQEKEKEIEKAAKDIQKEMKTKVVATSPIENYPSRSGIKNKIIVHRQPPGVPQAIKERAKYQPGDFKNSWVPVTYNTKRKNAIIYGVRNKRYQLTHLLNFEHAHFTWGRNIGVTKGTGFVDDVSDWGRQKLDREINRILNN